MPSKKWIGWSPIQPSVYYNTYCTLRPNADASLSTKTFCKPVHLNISKWKVRGRVWKPFWPGHYNETIIFMWFFFIFPQCPLQPTNMKGMLWKTWSPLYSNVVKFFYICILLCWHYLKFAWHCFGIILYWHFAHLLLKSVVSDGSIQAQTRPTFNSWRLDCALYS